jgi:hypothetical protein
MNNYKKMGKRLSLIVGVFLFCFMLLLTGSSQFEALAQPTLPWQDIGFTPTTPLPDPDVIIVREKAYGAEGVDLTGYGIGTGPVDFVQSIYFRFFVDNDSNTIDSFTGRVVFPAEVEIIGIITDKNDLGGEVDDGVSTETDLLFGIAQDPDDYSENARGFECCGTPARSEFVCVTSPNSFVFGLNISDGVDDFRVIIDYGDSFPEDLAFDMGSYDIGTLGGAVPSQGIRVGDDSNPTVLGSGDFGEIGSLIEIPLTSNTPPVPGGSIPFDAWENVYILRDTTGDTFVDAYDNNLKLPAPEQFQLEEGIGNPVGITDGPDGLLYAVGKGGGFYKLDPHTGDKAGSLLGDLAGDNKDLTGYPDLRDLFIVRDTSGDTMVDRLDVDALSFDEHYSIPQAVIGTPVAITDGEDGLLYIIGSGGGFASLDPLTAEVVDLRITPPSGSYVCLTGREGTDKLYLLRDTSADTYVDLYDTVTKTITYGFSSTSIIGSPASITDGPGDLLYLIGKGSNSAAGFVVVDPDSGLVMDSNKCMDFVGTNISMTNLVPAPLICECDLDQSGGSCNFFDWLIFIEDWGSCTEVGCSCDLNEDGSCNFFDWLIFIEDWGRTDCP